MLTYFAHEGVEHATTAEAAAHDNGSQLPVILAITAVVVLAVAVLVYLLSAAEPKRQSDKGQSSKKEKL